MKTLLLLLLLALGLLFFLAGRGAEEAPERAQTSAGQSESPLPAAAPLAPGAAAAESQGAAERRESAPSAPDSAAGSLELRFLDSAGAPLPGAAFALLQGSTRLASGLADGAGTVRVPAAGGSAQLVLAAPGHAPHLETLVLDPGTRELRLTAGFAVAGHVFVDGAPAREPVALALESERPQFEVTAEVLEALAGVADLEGAGPTYLRLRSDASGWFRCDGLPADWSGTLRCTEDNYMGEAYSLENYGAAILQVPAPRADLVLRLRRVPVLRGRVRQADGAAPTEPPSVSARMSYRNRSMSTGRQTDAEGGFRVPVRDPNLSALSLRIQPAGAPAFEHPVDPIPPDWNVGDILLPAVREIAFVALDLQGQAVAGVRASADEGQSWSAPSGGDGRGTVAALMQACTLRGRAPGYLSERPEVPESATGPVTLWMRASNELRVHVTDPEGAPVPGAMVVLGLDGPMLEGEDALNSLSERVFPGQMMGASWSDTMQQVELALDRNGRLGITGLRAGVRLRLQVRPPAGQALHDEELPPMPAFGLLEREIVARERGREFRGRVLDPGGRPIANAQVVLSAGGPDYVITGNENRSTDAQGEFTFEQVVGPTLRISIEAGDYVPFLQEDYLLPPEGEVAQFRLEPGYLVAVLVRREDGEPLDAWVHAAAPGGRSYSGETRSKGHYLLRGLPPGTIDVRITVGEANFAQAHDSRQPELLVELAATGTVELSLPDTVPAGAWGALHLERSDGGPACDLYFSRAPDSDGVVLLSDAPAGTYAASVRVYVDPDITGGDPWRTLAGPRPLTVRAGETVPW
ncbi:MAG: carboxypeptidase regulatory-like domain-containing protein [Planctomycetota bacterium]|nr:MAG: carboxypeptidase regulatory-like domain-containing protein [Planctomycetota bacterium]